MTKVSIIIPVYKTEKYIKRCIESVLIQETEEIDIECIIVDDCTPDKSIDIIQQHLNDYEGNIHFVFLKHQYNQGLSCARNTGFEASSGDYIFFLDSDDCLEQNCFKHFCEVINKYPEADLIIGNHFDEERLSRHFPKLQKLKILQENNAIIKEAYEDRLGFFAWNKLVKKSILKNNQILFTKGLIYEDILWSIKLYQHSKLVIALPYITYIYKFNGSSIMHSKSTLSNQMITSLSYITNKLLDEITKNNWGRCCVLNLRFMMMAIDLEIHTKCEKSTLNELHRTRNRLMHTAFKGNYFILCLFFLMMYWPIYYIQNISFFRKSFFTIQRLLYLCC